MPRHHEGEPTRESEPQPVYYQASRFDKEEEAKLTYSLLQEAIASIECDLSTYRFLLNDISHVVVIGEQPLEEFDQALQAILAAGERIGLPDRVLMALQLRRTEQSRFGSWVERHSPVYMWLADKDDE